eukprot:6172474-Pleurochrysis_carterae.AAC.3
MMCRALYDGRIVRTSLQLKATESGSRCGGPRGRRTAAPAGSQSQQWQLWQPAPAEQPSSGIGLVSGQPGTLGKMSWVV